MTYRDLEITKFPQSGFLIEYNEINYYIDPFKIPDGQPQANYILLTHDHFDHYDLDSIGRIIDTERTVIVGPYATVNKAQSDFSDASFMVVEPNSFRGSMVRQLNADVKIWGVPAYNIDKFREENKPYHPKAMGWLGFILQFGETTVYHMGDTDPLDEFAEVAEQFNIDILMVPVSGTYVMTADEAVEVVNQLQPTVAIPMHHDAGVVGGPEDVEVLRSSVNSSVQVEVIEPVVG